MNEVKYSPGDIVDLGGTKFVVLDNNYGGDGYLLILALKTQGEIRFGRDNDYVESNLRIAIDDWYCDLIKRIGYQFRTDQVRDRKLDLTTLDGCGQYGNLYTMVAPLTMDEARKYAGIIPPCDKPWWLATGWGGPEHTGSICALLISTNGAWISGYCPNSYGIRPALVIDRTLLNEIKKPDLSKYSTDALLAEIRSRTKTEI